MTATANKKILEEYDNFIKEFFEGVGEMTYLERTAAEAGVITETLFVEKITTQKPLLTIHEKYHFNFEKLLGEKWNL